MFARRYNYLVRNFSFNFFKGRMVKAEEAKVLEAKAQEAEALVSELRKDLGELKKTVVTLKAYGTNAKSSTAYQDLLAENAALKKEINEYKRLLTGRTSDSLDIITSSDAQVGANAPLAKASSSESSEDKAPSKPEKPVKEKKTEEKKGNCKSVEEEAPVDVGRLDFRIGKIVEVKKHPDADSLYVEKIDVGEAKPRTVVSGLVKHVTIEEMADRMVVVLCNLKPAKMRGIVSEAMVMCASADTVEILIPPSGSVPGDIVEVEGYPRVPDSVLNPKKKIFETVAPDLKTNSDKVATYKGVPWKVPGKGIVTAASLLGVNIK